MAKSTVYHALGLGISEKPENKNFFFTVFLNFFWELLGEKSEASELVMGKYKR